MTTKTKKPQVMVENISCILPQESQLGALFLGNVYGAQNPPILKQYGIRAVLTSSIQTDIEYSFKDVPFHMRISAHDKQNYNIKQHINQCIQFIENSRQLTNVYVHCFAGVSRSAAIVCAYIMWKLKWNYQTTIAFVKAKRIVANPNEGFVKQLIQMQNELLGIIEDGFNGMITGTQVPLLLTQNLLKQSSKNQKQKINNYPSNPTLSDSTFPTNRLDNLSLSQKQHSSANNHTSYDQQIRSHQSHINSKETNNRQSSSQISSYNTTEGLYYVDPQKIAKSKKSMQNNSKDYYDLQKTTITDDSITKNKFNYLQNFFPQNHTVKNQIDKTKNKINSTQMSNLNRAQSNTGQQKPRKSLKKLQNTQALYSTGQTLKQTSNYHIPKQSTSKNNQLILGGGKKPPTPSQNNSTHMLNSSYNHNSIPIPNIKEKSATKNKSQYNKNDVIMSESQQQQFYHTLNSGYNLNRTSTDSFDYNSKLNNSKNSGRSNTMTNSKNINLVTSPRANQQEYLQYDQITQKHNGLKSPVPYDFRNSASSDGFFTNNNLLEQKNDISKSSSRLVKPKDLPGYKNY